MIEILYPKNTVPPQTPRPTFFTKTTPDLSKLSKLESRKGIHYTF